MIEYNPMAQPRFIEPSHSPVLRPKNVEELFDEPDFISLDLENDTTFHLRWAAHDEVFIELDSISELIESVDGKGTISKTAVAYNPDGVGMETLPAFEDRIQNISLLTKFSSLHILPVNLSPAHETPTNEVWLTLNRNDTAARYIVSHCVAITAREGLEASTDAILDEFVKYLPILKNK